MAIVPIKVFPDPVLRAKTQEVSSFGAALRKLIANLTETMYSKNGAGIAAIQVGSLERIFIVEGAVAGGAENSDPVVFVNPKLVWVSDEKETTDEGCLSFPGIYVPIERSLRARVEAFDIEGKPFVAEGEGLYARAMQHEQDHLNNRLLIDYVSPLKRKLIKKKLEKMTAEEIEALQAEGE